MKRILEYDNDNPKKNITAMYKNICAVNDDDDVNKVYTIDTTVQDNSKLGACASGKIPVYNEAISSFNSSTSEFTLGYSFPTFASCETYENNNAFPAPNDVSKFCQ